MADPFILEVQFTRSFADLRQGVGKPSQLQLFVWISASQMKTTAVDGLALDHSGDTLKVRQLAPSEEVLREFVGVAAALKNPKIEARVDTSDCMSNNFLRIDLNGKQCIIDLPLMLTGFDGPDAPAVRRFFAKLLEIAGIKDDRAWRDLTDRKIAS